LAVVDADIGEQKLEQGDTPAVGGKGMAAAGRDGFAQAAAPPVSSAGGTGHIILGGVGENGELFGKGHRGHLLKGTAKNRTYVRIVYQPVRGCQRKRMAKKHRRKLPPVLGPRFGTD